MRSRPARSAGDYDRDDRGLIASLPRQKEVKESIVLVPVPVLVLGEPPGLSIGSLGSKQTGYFCLRPGQPRGKPAVVRERLCLLLLSHPFFIDAIPIHKLALQGTLPLLLGRN